MRYFNGLHAKRYAKAVVAAPTLGYVVLSGARQLGSGTCSLFGLK